MRIKENPPVSYSRWRRNCRWLRQRTRRAARPKHQCWRVSAGHGRTGKSRYWYLHLKVGYNRVHGYYIEISRGQSDKAPVEYIRRQTLKNAERFITPELKEFEDKALSAKSRALSERKASLRRTAGNLNQDLANCRAAAAAVAELDVLTTLG